MRLPRVAQVQIYFAAVLLLPRWALGQHHVFSSPEDPSLRLVHTAHYEIHTDVDEVLLKDLSARMDSMFDQYAKTFSDFKPATNAPSLTVYLFANEKKYLAFTDYTGKNTGGLFVAGIRPYLAAFEQGEGQGRDVLRRTLQHEAFHQFAHTWISRQLPPWMNEGMAQLFEESIWQGKDFVTDQVPPRRVRQLHADIAQKRIADFDPFLAMSPRVWSQTLHTDLVKAAAAYNQAWAMAYFCSSAGDPVYHRAFIELLKKLHDDQTEVDAATRKAFPDLEDFRKKFNAWAAKLKPTPLATLIENQDVLGDFMLAVTQDNHPAPADVKAFRELVVEENMKIQYTRNKFTFSTDERPAVYFSDVTGKLFRPDELFFKADATAPLPEIICQPARSSVRYRTHFYLWAGKTEHEMLIEPME